MRPVRVCGRGLVRVCGRLVRVRGRGRVCGRGRTVVGLVHR